MYGICHRGIRPCICKAHRVLAETTTSPPWAPTAIVHAELKYVRQTPLPILAIEIDVAAHRYEISLSWVSGKLLVGATVGLQRLGSYIISSITSEFSDVWIWTTRSVSILLCTLRWGKPGYPPSRRGANRVASDTNPIRRKILARIPPRRRQLQHRSWIPAWRRHSRRPFRAQEGLLDSSPSAKMGRMALQDGTVKAPMGKWRWGRVMRRVRSLHRVDTRENFRYLEIPTVIG